MKDMKKIMMILMAAALVALPTKAQNFGEDQQNVQFQSTSTMTPTGSAYSANPSLNADGLAAAPAAQGPARAGSGPKKAMGLPDLPNTTGKQDNTPIGDAVLPLTLIALAFCGVIYYRRRKALKC